MSNGTLNVQYDSCQIGRIKLQGRKHNMQIIYNEDKTEFINGNIDEFINAYLKAKGNFLK